MKGRGFTLIELLVTVAIVMTVLTLGVPTFENMVRDNRLTTLANDLLGMLNLARSEAIKRGAVVSVCKSVDGMRCGGSGWSDGWIVFVNQDEDSPPVVDPGEEILRYHETVPAGYSLGANNNFLNHVSYRPNGRSNNMGRFVFCKDNKLENHSRAIFVSITGRARVAQDENHNGIPDERNADNKIVDIDRCQF
jgi:type IV fimbrial biogenesis protein FimT